MASNLNLNLNDNGFRASKLLVDGGGYLSKQLLLQKAITGTITTIDEFLAEIKVRQTVKKLKTKSLIKGSQSNILYPSNGTPTDLDEWDITLVTLILNNCSTLSPAEFIAVQDIRDLRNSLYGHTAKMEMTDVEFQQKWKDISSTLTRHTALLTDPKCANFIQNLIAITETETLSAETTLRTWKQWHEWGIEVEQKIEESNEENKTRFSEAETYCQERHRDIQDRLSKVDSSLLKLLKEDKVQHVDRTELNRKIVQAKTTLEAYRRKLQKIGVPCETSLTETVTQQLKKNKIVVLKGLPGSGKTHLAKNVLTQFLSLNPTFDPLIIRQPNEIERVLDPGGSFVLLVDDMMGKISFDTTECKDWLQYIETFLSQLEVGELYVVVTIRTSIFRQCQNEELANMFLKENIIDTDTYLSVAEKRNILEMYRKHHDFDLSDDQTNKIIKQKSAGIGFPLLCSIMQRHDVDELFKRPTQYLKDMISPTKLKDPTLFVVLFLTLIGENRFCKNASMLTDNQTECFDTLQNYFKNTTMDIYMLNEAADKIERTFLTLNENTFVFIHEAVAHSTFVVALELVSDILIKWCPFKTLIKNMNLISETTNAETTNPYLKYKQLIINRMNQVMCMKGGTNDNIKSVTSATIWTDRSFAEEALSMFNTEQFYQKDEKGMCMCCHFARYGRKNPLEIVIRQIQKGDSNKYVDQLQKALTMTCRSAKNECFDVLISKVDINQEIVISAVKGGKMDIVKQIICKYGEDKINTLRERNTEKTILHIAAKKGRLDLVKYLHLTCGTILDKNDREGCNAAHSAAESVSKGAIECLDFIINLGINPRETNNQGESILNRAVLIGKFSTVQHICETYPDLLQMADIYGNNVLHDAAFIGTVKCAKFLVENGINPIDKTTDEETILHRAAFGGNIATVKFICETYPALIHVTDKYGNNALHIAAQEGTGECLKFLVGQGINPNNMDCGKDTILHKAAKGGNIETLKCICETYPELTHFIDSKGNNAIHVAAEEGTIECLKFLVSEGIDPLQTTDDTETILHKAAQGENIATVKYICETYPGLMNKTDSNGDTALHCSAIRGQLNIVKLLIDQGIDPENISKDEETILHRSAFNVHIGILKFVCETYPKLIQLTDKYGNNAVHDAAEGGNVECLKFLVSEGIDPRAKTYDKETILHKAAQGENIATVKYICETYPELIHLTDKCGNNALHNAAKEGTVELLKFLIGQGVDPQSKTNITKTILHKAATGGNIVVMKYICEAYPDLLCLPDNKGNNALHDAAFKGNVECIKCLVHQGLDPRDKTTKDGTILHRAAIGGHIETIKYICEAYPDLLCLPDIYGNNALHAAALKGNAECIKCLVHQGFDPRDKSTNENTILHRSAIGGNIDSVKYICETYPELLHITDSNGNNALYYAAFKGNVKCVKFLAKKGINPINKTTDGTLLHRATQGGNIATVKYICETYPELIHITDSTGKSALHFAAMTGSVECLKFLISQGLDPRDITTNSGTILQLSAYVGNIAIVNYICEIYPELIHKADQNGYNALHYTAKRGSVECLRFLVSQGIDPRDKITDGGTILHLSAFGGNINIVQYICETYPELIHIKDKNGFNALHFTANNGSVDCLKFLVSQGIDPTDKITDGETILHLSAFGGNINIVQYICETYPEMIHIKDKNGFNALHFTANNGSVDCLKILVSQGIEPRDKITDGGTILHLSAFGGNINIVQYICETYPELIHIKDKNGFNALHFTAKRGSVDCLKFLVSQGIDPRDKITDGETILHLSAFGGNINIVQYICETYPELIHIKDKNEFNALHFTANNGSVDCLKFLVSQGIDPRDNITDGGTILHLSAFGGNINIVHYICETYPDLIHINNKNGFNALHFTAENGSFDCLKFLVSQGIDPGDKITDGGTILHLSAFGGNINNVQYICETYPELIHIKDKKGFNALHFTAENGSVDCLKFLVSQGIDPRDKITDGGTILHLSAFGGNINIVQYICETYPETIHIKDKNGFNALHFTANNGSVDCLKFFVSQGIEPRYKITDGGTILHLSAFGGNINIVQYICETFPELIHIKDKNGFNALHFTAKRGSVDCLKFLVSQGIDPRDKITDGGTILHLSAFGGNINIVQYICETYPDLIHIKDKNGFNALHFTAENGSVDCLKFLVSQGIDPGDKITDGGTILHLSAFGGNINIVQYICETYPELIHIKDKKGFNALHFTAENGSVDCLKFIVSQGIDTRDKLTDGETILHLSAIGGNINIVQYICETYPELIHIKDKNGFNALHFTAKRGSVECLKFLVSQGIDPRDKITDGETILHLSAFGGNINIVQYICETYPELIHIKDKNGFNALHFTAESGSVDCLKFLVSQGIDPRDKNTDGETILHLSAFGGNINIVQYICETYPELIHIKDKNGFNALHFTAENGSVDCLKFLVSQGIDPRDKITDGGTILHLSAFGGNINIVQYICETYPELIHIKDKNGFNALHFTANKGSVDCLKFLVSQGIDPGDKCTHGGTILHLSAFGGNINIVQYICETYPELIHLRDSTFKSVLHFAVIAGTVECFKFLIGRGLDPRDKTTDNVTILHLSAICKNIATVKYICETYPELITITDKRGNNALHYTAARGTVESLKFLVGQEIVPEDTNTDGGTILHLSAKCGNISTVKYICETYPEMIHLTDKNGNNALQYTAMGGTVECLKFLVDQEIDPNHITTDGNTILHKAAIGGNIVTMAYICEAYPVLLCLPDNKGNNALHVAAFKGNVECIKFLVHQGLDPRDKSTKDGTILHRASKGGHIAIVKYICDNYPELIHILDSNGNSAIHHAAKAGSVECLKFLIGKGIDPGCKTNVMETILHKAAIGGKIELIKYICEAYPKLLNAADINGRNVLHKAVDKGKLDCIQFLEGKGLNQGDENAILQVSTLGKNTEVSENLFETDETPKAKKMKLSIDD